MSDPAGPRFAVHMICARHRISVDMVAVDDTYMRRPKLPGDARAEEGQRGRDAAQQAAIDRLPKCRLCLEERADLVDQLVSDADGISLMRGAE